MINWRNSLFLTIFWIITSNIYADNLDSMISKLIIDKLGNDVLELEISFDAKSKVNLVKLRRNAIKNVELLYFAPNYSSFRVNVTLENEEIFDLFGRYSAYMNVPVTSRVIPAGTIMTDEDIKSVRTPYSAGKSAYIRSVHEIIGKQARKNIASGSLIRQNDVIKPQIIRKGDNVNIVYNKGNIKLSTNGISTQSGAEGDAIKVKNETTGAIVSAKVKDKNLVEVGIE
ncbi:MAG UNVERIFIED_CONTAM: flagellar basal body P-ring formation chaperone FlgA [Rickettsiaceae bacterium]|jgi:flagella basal body P-ring formation protein FlgA